MSITLDYTRPIYNSRTKDGFRILKNVFSIFFFQTVLRHLTRTTPTAAR